MDAQGAAMSKPTRYSFLVTIEQLPWSSDRKPDFGSQEAWGMEIRHNLDASLHVAQVIEVKPTRTRNATK
jgi:hypothetical protein